MSSRPFSILQVSAPLFSLFFPKSVQPALPCCLEVPPLGFGYPFDGVSSSQTLESLFQLPTLLGFTLQSFPPTQGSKKRFRFSSPLLRFKTKPQGPDLCASTASSPCVSRASRRSQRFRPGQGLCSLGSLGLWGSPSTYLRERLLSSPRPFRPSKYASLRRPICGTLRVPKIRGLALFLRRGRRPL